MPPVVGIVIAAIAAIPEVVGTASIFGAISAEVAIDATAIGVGAETADIVGGIAAGATVGAAAGSATAAAAGTDPGQGALFGAATGALTAGLTPAVADVTGFGNIGSQAIAQGLSTTAVQAGLAGVPIGTALEEGAIAGAGSELGSQAVSTINSLVAPPTGSSGFPSTPSDPTGSIAKSQALWNAQNDGIERTSLPTSTFGGIETTSQPVQPSPSPAETVVETGVKAAPDVTSGLYRAPETVVSTGQKSANATPDILAQIQSSPVTKSAEKSAVATAFDTSLFDLLFGNGGASAQPSAAVAPAPVSVAGAGLPGATGGGATNLSPAAQAALSGQSGQAGSTSAYAPGGPIFGDLGSGKTQSPWNTDSLRTGTGG